MNTKIIFNINTDLKKAAMKKAQEKRIPLSVFLNLATEAFVADRLEVSLFDQLLQKSKKEVVQKKVTSQELLFQRLGI